MHEIPVRHNAGSLLEPLQVRPEFHHEIVNLNRHHRPVVFGLELPPIDAAHALVFREMAVFPFGIAVNRLLQVKTALVAVGINPVRPWQKLTEHEIPQPLLRV